MNKQRKFCHRALSIFMALIMVFTSLSLENFFKMEVKAAGADEKYFTLNLGAAEMESGKFTLPNATVKINTVNNVKKPITSLSISVDIGSIVDPDSSKMWDYTDILDQDPNNPKIKYKDKHRTVTWYSAFVGLSEEASAQKAQEIIRAMEFIYEPGMNIEVTVDGNKFNLPKGTITGYKLAESSIQEYGNHYYMYVDFQENNMKNSSDKLWTNCYQLAKTYSYMGLKGYLVTITEVGEDITLNNITTKGAWAGAGRVYDSYLEKPVDEFKLDQADSSGYWEKDGSGNPKNPISGMTSWVWLNGPEAGRYIRNEGATDVAKYSDYINEYKEGYSNWKRPSGDASNQEPNNYNKTEWLMLVHFGNPSEKYNEDKTKYKDANNGWNDNPNTPQSGQVDGFFVEFSEYDNNKYGNNGYVNDFNSGLNVKYNLNLDEDLAFTEQGDKVIISLLNGEKLGEYSLTALDDMYTGAGYEYNKASDTDITDAAAAKVEKSEIKYRRKGETTFLTGKPTEYGEYEAVVTLTYNTTSTYDVIRPFKIFEIVDDASGNHSGIKTKADGNDILATIKIEPDNWKKGDTPGVPEIEGEDDFIDKTGWAFDGFYFEGRNGTVYGPSEDMPTDAGDYIVYAFLEDKERNVVGRIETPFSITRNDLNGLVKDSTNKNVVYDGQNHSPKIDLDDSIKNDAVIYYSTDGGATWTTDVPEYKNVGEYTIDYKVLVDGAEPYIDKTTIKITPKNIDVKPKDSSKYYLTEDPEFTYESDGLIPGDELKGIVYDREDGEEVGDYAITFTIDDSLNPNYIITAKPGKFSILNHEDGDHDVDYIKGYPATCFEPGLTDGIYCKDCDVWIKRQEVIPPLGHRYDGEWIIEREPTATTEGKRYKICYNGCGYKLIESIPRTGEKPDPKKEAFRKDAEVLPGSPIDDIVFNNSKDELLNAPSIFTEEERQRVLAGEDSRIWMEIKGIDESTLDPKEKEAIVKEASKSLGDNPELVYFDVSLFKRIGAAADPVRITNPGTKISITITIPNELLNHDRSMVREYHIVRLHEGKAELLDGYFNDETNEFTFETDLFSVYSIGYADYPVDVCIYEDLGPAIKLNKTEFIYTGKEIRPSVKVYYYYQDMKKDTKRNGSYKKILLKENVDYIVTYKNNINAGTASLTITGIGDYSLSETKKFTIFKKDAKKLKICKLPNLKATGFDLRDTISANVVVTDGKTIVDPSEYTVVFNDNLNSNTASGKVKVTIKINPDGNYRGVANKAVSYCTIYDNCEYDLTNATVEVVSKNGFYYTGKMVKPKIKVMLNGKKLSSKYYNVIYQNNVNAGDATVYVAAKGKKAVGASKKAVFTILPKDFAKVKIKKFSKTYWRKDLTNIRPIVKSGKDYLTKDKDYVMTVSGNLDTAEFKSQLASQKKVPVLVTIKPAPGNTNYKDYTADQSGISKVVYITKRNIKSGLTLDVDPHQDFSSANAVPKITLTYLNDVLTEGEDFTVTYKTKLNKKSGQTKVTAKVTGTGIYKGKKTFIWYTGQNK